MEKDDLISRAYVLAEYDRQHKGPPCGARKIMEEAPAVDAMPVVRCRDCLWRGENKVCTYLIGKTLDDFYCAIGEKRHG